ncbi:MAG: DUF2155 domain-containing protein [Desulfuromonas sp.]|nr:MAG: DUF2155 domain-containing protein [Desulfuromonas sp.]
MVWGFLFLLVTLCGCDLWDTEDVSPQYQPHKQYSQVVVPPEVEGQWKAVVIGVVDRDSGQSLTVTATIGEDYSLPESHLRFRVKSFLPHFVVDGMTMTSVSNKPVNPAAMILLFDNDLEVFRGWLFSRYRNTHSFQHPRFSFNLIDFVPTGEKGVDKKP